MPLTDILLAVIIFGGAVYLLYRSIWKKKGHCSGCRSTYCKIKGKILL
ncbi:MULTISPECIES: FeoB-associated Cys-rich membrane protein [Thermodesulfovibrio]